VVDGAAGGLCGRPLGAADLAQPSLTLAHPLVVVATMTELQSIQRDQISQADQFSFNFLLFLLIGTLILTVWTLWLWPWMKEVAKAWWH
jgi:hypothetical protein